MIWTHITFCCLYLRITWPIAQISVTSFSIDQFSTAPSCCYAEENTQTTAFRRQNTQNVTWMKRQFSACQTPRSMYPSIFNSFPIIRTASAKKSLFSRTAAHIFVSPWEAPATITQYVAWMERQFNACQTPRSMYLSFFNSFRVIWCLSQCTSPKIAIFTTFLFPQRRPWGNHAKCCMNGKRIRCLQIVSLLVPI